MAVTSAGLHAHEPHRPHPTTGRIEMLSRKATMATHAEADLARIAGEQQLKHAAAEKVTPTPILAPALALEPAYRGLYVQAVLAINRLGPCAVGSREFSGLAVWTGARAPSWGH